MKPSTFRRVLQVAAFVRKEALEIVRQPRLLLTLVFGPFLIMAVFGLGYRDTPDPMKTIFVAPRGSPLLEQAQTYAKDAGPFVTLVGVTNDPTAARQRLMDGDVDLVVSFPDDPLSTVLDGQQATIRVVHTRLDPIQRTAISFASRLAIDQINGQILAQIVEGGQGLARPASEAFSLATGAISSLDQAISTQDQARADAALADLEDAVARLSLSARAVDAASERLMGDRASATEDVTGAIAELRQNVDDLRSNLQAQDVNTRLARIRELLDTVNQRYDQLTAVDPGVLVRPFRSEVELAVHDVGKVTDWYAPAAVILMLQQFGVAFGALTFVRERQLGITDIFRVAPINATETLLGKYVAYLAVGGAIAAVLTALVVVGLDVPMSATRRRRRHRDGVDALRVDRGRLRDLPDLRQRRPGRPVHDDPAPGQPLLQRVLPLGRSDGRARALPGLAASCHLRDAAPTRRHAPRGPSRSLPHRRAHGVRGGHVRPRPCRHPSTSGRGVRTDTSSARGSVTA